MFRKTVVVCLALTAVLSPAALAQAVYSTGFEQPTFMPGDVQGQDGWGYYVNSPTKGAIEPAPAGSPASFGTQSLAVRTRNTAFFGVANHLFSPLIDPAAGENGSTIGGVVVPDPRTHFSATLWVHTPVAPIISADGRFAELDPSSKGPAEPVANRYAQVRFSNSTNALDGKVRVEMGWYKSTGYSPTTVADLEWNQWYRFEYRIELVDGTNGAEPNDRFTVTIFDLAGNQLGTVCGSTWELPWRSGSFGGSATPRGINGFDFWSRTGPDDTLVAWVDNMTMTAFDATPLAVAATGTTSVCAGATTTLSAATTGEFPVTAYAWRDAANALVGTGPTLIAGAGTYTVTVTDTLCVNAISAPVTVSEIAAPSVSISGVNTVPVGARSTLTANVTGGGAITGYEWRDQGGNAVGSAATYDAAPGTYTVTVTTECGTATSAAFVVAAAAQADVPTASEWGLMALLAMLAAAAVLRLR